MLKLRNLHSILSLGMVASIIGALMFTPLTVKAAFTAEKKIAGCTFYSYLTNKSGKKITSIAPKTEFYVVIEWSPGLGDNQACDNFDSAEIGWYSGAKFYPQYCAEPAKLVGNKKVVKAKFNTVDDAEVSKYVMPQNGVSVCNENEPKSETEANLMKLSGKVSASTSTGGGDSGGGGGGDNNPPPTDTGPDGKDNKDINSGVTAKLMYDLDTELGSFFNPLDDELTVPGLVVRLINIVLVFSGMVAVAFIIYGGLIMVSAAGNESRVTKGKNTLIYAVAGLIVSILSFSIVALIQGVIS